MFTSRIGCIRAVVMAVAVSALTVLVHADATLNPNTTATYIEVKSLTLEGFSSIEAYPLDILALRAQLNAERARFGERMTVDELHQIADALTLYVRGKGFTFHTVYLPPQKVAAGAVHLELQEGVLADVHVINKTAIASRRFERVFKPLVGKMLYAPAVEERVQALRSQAGVSVFAFYSRGKSAGEARLNLRVEPSRAHQFSLKADNFGSPTSGEYRLIGQWHIAQFTKRFDSLVLAVLASIDEVPNYYGSLSYARPTASLNYIWDISASNNQFELGDRFANLGLQGDATIVKAGISYQRHHHPAAREAWRLGYATKTNDLDLAGAALEQERSDAASLGVSKSWQLPERGFASQTQLTVHHGTLARSATDEDRFTKLEWHSQLVKGLGRGGRLQSVLSLDVSWQRSDVNLPSVEAFSLSGPYGVRGFEPGQFSADDALLVTAEWSLPNVLRVEGASWGVEPYGFIDWAQGEQLALAQTPASSAEFSGAGGGVRFYWGKHVSGQLYGAGRINGDIDGNTVYGEQLWRFELRLH